MKPTCKSNHTTPIRVRVRVRVGVGLVGLVGLVALGCVVVVLGCLDVSV